MVRTASQKKLQNRENLRALGHETTATAIAEITKGIPSFTMTSGYPTVNGTHPSLAALVLHVRGKIHLTFDAPRPRFGFVERKDQGEPTRVWRS